MLDTADQYKKFFGLWPETFNHRKDAVMRMTVTEEMESWPPMTDQKLVSSESPQRVAYTASYCSMVQNCSKYMKKCGPPCIPLCGITGPTPFTAQFKKIKFIILFNYFVP